MMSTDLLQLYVFGCVRENLYFRYIFLPVLHKKTDYIFFLIRFIVYFCTHIAPDGPPIEARMTDVQASTISLSWLPPEPELRNGRIRKYAICIRIFSTFPGSCLREIILDMKNTLDTRIEYDVVDLKPYTKYIVDISAGTAVGFGPSVALVNETQQAGKGIVVYFGFNQWTIYSIDQLLFWARKTAIGRAS